MTALANKGEGGTNEMEQKWKSQIKPNCSVMLIAGFFGCFFFGLCKFFHFIFLSPTNPGLCLTFAVIKISKRQDIINQTVAKK